jgi:hypothetical protein
MTRKKKKIWQGINSTRVTRSFSLAMLLFLSSSFYLNVFAGQNSISTETHSIIVFRLENYSRSEDAEKKLMELFLIGSSINVFYDRMKSFGIDCLRDRTEGGCEKIIPISSVSGYSWHIGVSEKQGKIISLYARRTLTPYYRSPFGNNPPCSDDSLFHEACI